MQEEIRKLQARMEVELEEIGRVGNPIERYTLSITRVHHSIQELRAFLGSYTFENKNEEINYFRSVCPEFYSKHFYFTKVYNIELLKSSTSKESLRSVYEHDLKEIDLFFIHNNDFCRYYFSGSTYLDEQLFTRHDGNRWPYDDLSPVMDSNFSIASYKVSWIIANQKYRYYLQRELKLLEGDLIEESASQESNIDSVSLGGSKSYLVEEIVALQLAELIYVNGEPASLAWLTKKAEQVLNTDLKDFKSLDYANRGRKDITPLLTSMIKKYINRANRLNK